MSPRELGCRTVGCGLGMLLVFGFFGYLLNVADTGLRDAVKRRAAGDAKFDLPLLHAGIARYAEANGDRLPPLTDADALRAALHPGHVPSEATFLNLRDRRPYVPNPALSGKTRAAAAKALPADSAALLYEATPDALGLRRVLLLDGTVREVPAGDWEGFRAAAKLGGAP